MKKLIWFAGGILVALLVVGVVGSTFAQAPTPEQPFTPGVGMMGRGMMGRGPQGQMIQGGLYGPMHDDMVAALAGPLGLSEDEINTRLTNGETMLQIAESKGLSSDQITQIFADAHKAALEKSVEAGEITREQADWMLQRMDGGNYGQGCGSGGMMRGRGAGTGWQQQPSS